ncbi:hypothetical protein BMI76_06185 [Streptococcus sp. 'caviae']|nr:hypothetical protein BMI76_06185 [Streptococcus sp. 'caviae']
MKTPHFLIQVSTLFYHILVWNKSKQQPDKTYFLSPAAVRMPTDKNQGQKSLSPPGFFIYFSRMT